MDVIREQGHRHDERDRPLSTLIGSPRTTTALVVFVAVGYFIVARLSLLLAFEQTNATPVWPPTGIALAAVLLLGYRVTPGIFAGAFFANILTLTGVGFSFPDSAIISVATASGNTLEALAGGALIRRFTGNSYPFGDVRDVFVFVVFGALLSAMIGSTVGVTTFCLRHGDWALYYRLWLTWWLGDATGVIVVAPLCLAWQKLKISEWRPARVGEAIVLCALLTTVSGVVFTGNSALKYAVLPVLLWVILRFGLFETSVSIVLVSGLAVYGTLRGGNPVGTITVSDSLLFLQSYICVVGSSALFLSAVVREQRRTVNALRVEKAFADTVIDSVPGAFYVLDNRGRLVRWNRFLEEINELAPEELTEMNSLRHIHDDDRELITGKIAEALEKGQSEAEGRILSRSGLRYFLFTGRRVDIEGVAYVVGSGIDITERKLAEIRLGEHQRDLEKTIENRTAKLTELNAALLSEMREHAEKDRTLVESEKKYRDLVEGANSVILRWTKEGRITFINTFAQRFFGYSEEEIVGRDIVGTIVPPTESSGRDLSSLVKDIFEYPGAYVLNENENVRKDGERVWVSWTNKPIVDNEGRVVEILSVGNDITRRKYVEDRLKSAMDELAAAKERAEAADHLKSAFLATMSHELRTPLNSIIGFTGIILQGYVGPLNDEQTKQLSMVRKSANHLLSLINDVLDISKIEAGQMQVSLDSFSLRAVLDQSVQSTRPAAEKKGLTLSSSIAPDVDGIISDRRRVEQIVLNLLSNAIKFTETGEVHVEAKREEDGSVTVCVSDTGIGIREEDMGRLFNAFQQVDSGITRKYEGTGLGLYICQRLVELLGGRIWVTSRWGAGTTFCFSLPDRGGRP